MQGFRGHKSHAGEPFPKICVVRTDASIETMRDKLTESFLHASLLVLVLSGTSSKWTQVCVFVLYIYLSQSIFPQAWKSVCVTLNIKMSKPFHADMAWYRVICTHLDIEKQCSSLFRVYNLRMVCIWDMAKLLTSLLIRRVTFQRMFEWLNQNSTHIYAFRYTRVIIYMALSPVTASMQGHMVQMTAPPCLSHGAHNLQEHSIQEKVGVSWHNWPAGKQKNTSR